MVADQLTVDLETKDHEEEDNEAERVHATKRFCTG